jgi:hypothetical protein
MPHIVRHIVYMANQITIRGIDTETEKRVKDIARRYNISLNKAAIMLIRKGAGINEDDLSPEVIGNSLDSFIGSWSSDEESEFLKSIEDTENIDQDMWK